MNPSNSRLNFNFSDLFAHTIFSMIVISPAQQLIFVRPDVCAPRKFQYTDDLTTTRTHAPASTVVLVSDSQTRSRVERFSMF